MSDINQRPGLLVHLSHTESSAQRQAFAAVAPCNGMDCSPAQCFYILCWDGTSGSGYPDAYHAEAPAAHCDREFIP